MKKSTDIMISTKRLILREFKKEDEARLLELYSDPHIIRYTGEEPFVDVKQAGEFISAYGYNRQFGYGRWAVELKESAEFIGWCGLNFFEEEGVTDLGYRIFRKHWNRGFATEAAIACLEQGFNHFQLDEILAWVLSENTRSVRVLEKSGFTYWKDQVYDRVSWRRYKIEAPLSVMSCEDAKDSLAEQPDFTQRR